MRNKSFRGNSAHFLALRKRLDVMGYADLPLGLDTAPLAQQMLEDLVSTTDSLKSDQEEIDVLKEKLELALGQIEPFQSENSILTRDNNQLHLNLIKQTEEIMKLKNQQAQRTFELESENRRLKLLNVQSSSQVKNLLNTIEDLKKKLQASIALPAMMKIPETIESDPKQLRKGSGKSTTSSRTPSVVSSETTFPSSSLSFDPSIFKTELSNLRKERDDAKEHSEIMTAKMNELETSLKMKDEEIQRLGDELKRQTGQDGYLITLKHKCEKQQQEIEKLHTQAYSMNPHEKTKYSRKRKMILTRPITTVSIDEGGFNSASVISSIKNQESEFSELDEDSSSTTRLSRSSSKVQMLDSRYSGNGHNNQLKEELDNQKKVQNILKSNIENLEKNSKIVIAQKDSEINSLKQENANLNKVIEEKNEKISKISADLASANEKLASIVNEKDKSTNKPRSKRKNSSLLQPRNSLNDLTEIQEQFENMKKTYDREIESKDEEIKQLRLAVKTAESAAKGTPKKCQNCIKLKQQIEELQNTLNNSSSSGSSGKRKTAVSFSAQLQKQQTDDVQKLKNKIVQLESQIKSNEVTKSLTNSENLTSSVVVQYETKIAQLEETITRIQKDLKDTQGALEESEQKLFNFPDAEERLRSTVEQLRSQNILVLKENKVKQNEIKNLKDRLIEVQRINKEQQNQLQKAHEEAESCRNESESCRTKYEEVTKKANEKNFLVVRDANAALQNLQKQLTEKTNECEMYQKLLSEARRQLAPLTENMIPQYQTQIAQMHREHDELIKKVKRISQLATYADRANTASFSTAVRQLQTELRKCGF